VDGDGLGAVVDQLRHGGFGTGLYEFHGGARAFDADAYVNRRAECWGLMAAWLKAGAQIPDDPELATGSHVTAIRLQQQVAGPAGTQRRYEVPRPGLASPDCGDVLAMGFSVTVAPRSRPERPREPMLALEQGWML